MHQVSADRSVRCVRFDFDGFIDLLRRMSAVFKGFPNSCIRSMELAADEIFLRCSLRAVKVQEHPCSVHSFEPEPSRNLQQ